MSTVADRALCKSRPEEATDPSKSEMQKGWNPPEDWRLHPEFPKSARKQRLARLGCSPSLLSVYCTHISHSAKMLFYFRTVFLSIAKTVMGIVSGRPTERKKDTAVKPKRTKRKLYKTDISSPLDIPSHLVSDNWVGLGLRSSGFSRSVWKPGKVLLRRR